MQFYYPEDVIQKTTPQWSFMVTATMPEPGGCILTEKSANSGLRGRPHLLGSKC
jgi:hypothetical protein